MYRLCRHENAISTLEEARPLVVDAPPETGPAWAVGTSDTLTLLLFVFSSQRAVGNVVDQRVGGKRASRCSRCHGGFLSMSVRGVFVPYETFSLHSANDSPIVDGMGGGARSTSPANGLDQLVFRHLAATLDGQFLRSVVEFLLRPILEGLVRIAGALGARVGCFSALATLFINGPAGDLLGLLLRSALILIALFDMLVLSLLLVAPSLLWHENLLS